METYCRVVLRDATRAFDREYTYRIPEALEGRVKIGIRVLVPFGQGNKDREAYVTALSDTVDSDFFIKPISQLLSSRPDLLPDQIRLAERMRVRWLCSTGDALKCMVSATVTAINDRTVQSVELVDSEEATKRLANGEINRVGQLRVIELLLETGNAPVTEVMHACHVSRSVLRTLEKNEWIRFIKKRVPRPQADLKPAVPQEPFEPNEDQGKAIEAINDAMVRSPTSDKLEEFLLFGVTGSGKTEVYLHCAQAAVSQGRGVLILVPEIALTPLMISRIRSRFGDEVAVLHSRLTPAQRYEQWQRILRQDVRVVVGARSAVFAPIDTIGLIIIDEEQETTYKSETHPRYHARDIARIRCLDHGAVLLLGSATPSIESYTRCRMGQATLLVLRERIGAAGMAKTEIVDMRRELAEGNRGIFSRRLEQLLREAFVRGQQAIIFINRRGYAGFVLCRHCGYVVRCPSCSVTMTTHLDRHDRKDQAQDHTVLICHYCGRIKKVPQICPVCKSTQIGRFGIGTQQVESIFNQTFAPATALRMDQDTTVGRQAHERILDAFEHREAQALVGTQMIAKGHDFPNVTVVGILSADLMLGLSDFRAPERTFQLITQAAGRAGRGEQPGTVVIQAYNVDDYAIRCAAAQDYPSFYEQEIAYRRKMQYPPFGAICSITLSSLREADAKDRCTMLHEAFRARLEDEPGFFAIQLMPPAKAPIYRIRNRYRRRLIIKGPQHRLLASFIAPVVDRIKWGNVAAAIDFDPYNLM